MSKTQEELNAIKNEYKMLSAKLDELSEDELNAVTGGIIKLRINANQKIFFNNGNNAVTVERRMRDADITEFYE